MTITPLERRILLQHASGMTREELLMRGDKPLSPEVQKKFNEYIERRKKHEPISYITGRKEFYSREFEVSPAVLIPRPESELFIDYAKKLVAKDSIRILELGVGSGAVLITLLLEFPTSTGVGVDISDGALEMARRNVEKYLLLLNSSHPTSPTYGGGEGGGRIMLFKSDWFSQVSGKFDLIVCNPPYVAHKDRQGLQPDLAYEPELALFAEKEGLACYEEIAHNLPSALADNGFALFEIGLGMLDAIKEIFTSKGLKFRGCLDDFSGIPRIAAFSATEQ